MSFATFLNQAVTLYVRQGFDRYGAATFAGGADYPARAQPISKAVLMPDGETVNANLEVYVRGDVVISNDDKIVYNGQKYKVIAVDTAIYRDGSIHHLNVTCTTWSLA